jgi:hypothetical protein
VRLRKKLFFTQLDETGIPAWQKVHTDVCGDNKQTNKPIFFVSVAAPRQQGRNDQTHRGQNPSPKSSDQENKIQQQDTNNNLTAFVILCKAKLDASAREYTNAVVPWAFQASLNLQP